VTVRWSENAVADLENIYDFIAHDKPAAAREAISMLFDAADRLALYPNGGRTGRRNGTRELVKSPFVMVYSIDEQVIYILAVFHGSRRYE
jgi:toxin ParE1/3/4